MLVYKDSLFVKLEADLFAQNVLASEKAKSLWQF